MPVIDPALVRWSRPEDARGDTPLLVLLHGVGSDEHDLMGLAPGLPPSWALASPRAPLPHGPGHAWYPLSTPGAPDPTAVDDAVEAVLTWLDTVAPAHGRVALLGFSQGGSMAVQALRARPTAFEAVVSLSGFVVPGADHRDDAVAAARPRLFIGHGDRDPVIPPAATARTSAWAAAHTAVTDRTYAGLGHGVATEELADVHRFLGA
ncbi:alpha/beta hydrolase [Curtobacterium sp. RRHDQ10]|uniref:alpha/beta hydrolase n=1 Tax=Curtobacterium phyllosphaerae TaxID=3413379 RepID=UPI003BF42EAD